MRKTRNLLTLAAATTALLSLSCGYQQSNKYGEAPDPSYKWQSLYRQDIQTVAIPIFANTDFDRGVEFKLTQALVQQVEANSPYKVVDRQRAETILEGEITRVETNTLSLNQSTATPQEQMLTVRINYTWKDLRSGKILRQRRDFEQSVAYYPTLGESASVGQRTAIEKLALAIVRDLQADW